MTTPPAPRSGGAVSAQGGAGEATVAPAARPFAAMLRGALIPSALAGVLAVIGAVLWRGSGAWSGALIGLIVSLAFYASGMFLMSRLVRSASPHAFFAVAMAVYFGQVIGLLVVIILFHDKPWVDGMALGVVALVVTLVWQAASMVALRRARIPVYDEPSASPTSARPGDGT